MAVKTKRKKIQTLPKGWRKTIRETGLVEWICPHDVGHPAPLKHQPAYFRKVGIGPHGCDGCCHK